MKINEIVSKESSTLLEAFERKLVEAHSTDQWTTMTLEEIDAMEQQLMNENE